MAKSAAQLSHAQSITGLGFWEWDPRTDALHSTDQVARIFSMRPEHFPKTLAGLLELIHPEDRDMVQKSLQEGVAKEQLSSLDNRIFLPNGTQRNIQSQLEPARDESNRVEGMSGTVQGITDRKLAEEKIHFLAYYDSLIMNRLHQLRET